MSQISAREDSKSHAARDHWIAERIFDWSGVPTVHLRLTFFSQWLLYPFARKTIIEQSIIDLPYGAGRHAPIAAEDQARLIAAILVEPAAHVGNPVARAVVCLAHVIFLSSWFESHAPCATSWGTKARAEQRRVQRRPAGHREAARSWQGAEGDRNERP